MIWYYVSVTTGSTVFIILLITTIFQTLIAIEAGRLLHDRITISFIRALYGSLAAISAVLSLEGLTAMASIEGCVFLSIPTLFRWISIFPALLLLFYIGRPIKLPVRLNPSVMSIFVPLLRLPPVDRIVMPLPVFFAVFAAVWLMFDAIQMLLSMRAYAQAEITSHTMLHVIRSMDHGICVANRRGQILETNPAFYSLCEELGVSRFEHIDELNKKLKTLCDSNLLKINNLEDGRSIHTHNFVYFLQQNSFKTGGKTFIQMSLSDVTKLAHTSLKLERDNEKLTQNNKELGAVISEIEFEERINERQRLCRAAHDYWSQRLAVAGLSIDILLNSDNRHNNGNTIKEITEILKIPDKVRTEQIFYDLDDTLKEFTSMYKRLGVKIRIHGNAVFTKKEQEALYATFREALANAVRHAYARHIFIEFYENNKEVGVLIKNHCFDDETGFTEGRGLHDIRIRVQGAGGTVRYKKTDFFEIKVSFSRDTNIDKEMLIQCG